MDKGLLGHLIVVCAVKLLKEGPLSERTLHRHRLVYFTSLSLSLSLSLSFPFSPSSSSPGFYFSLLLLGWSLAIKGRPAAARPLRKVPAPTPARRVPRGLGCTQRLRPRVGLGAAPAARGPGPGPR